MPTPPIERLYLLDGMALAYRAYFSFIQRPLINSKGENTSAVYGFINTLLKVLEEDRPEHVAVVFDTKEPTFRHIMYEPYKATRQKMPDEMSGQLSILKDVVRAFNVPCLEVPGYEADDIMGTLARKAEREGVATFLVTGDKDFMQLISPLIRMYKPGIRGEEWEILDEVAVMTKFGVTPEQVTDVLGLTGDKSDNVPGVPGIGEKTAIPLVRQWGSIESIISHVEEITPKGVQQKIRENIDKALLSKKLVTIHTDVPLDTDIHGLRAKSRDNEKLGELFDRLEFRTLRKRLLGETESASIPPPPAATHLNDVTTDPHTYHLVDSIAKLKKLVRSLEKSDTIAVDTETTATDPLLAILLGISLSVKPGEAWYIPVASTLPVAQVSLPVKEKQDDLFAGEVVREDATPAYTAASPRVSTGLPLDTVKLHLGPILANPSVRKAGQNLKYDMLVLQSHGFAVQGPVFDTMIAHHVLVPDAEHNIDALAAEQLQYKMITYDELTKVGKERRQLADINVAKVAEYSAQDADITLRLHLALDRQLREQSLMPLCEDVEFPLIPVLAAMEMAGVKLDLAYLADLSKEMDRGLQELTDRICSMAGEKFNINSTQQLSKILFEKLKLSAVRKTKTGFSTDLSVLETLRKEHGIIEFLLEYRQIQKLKSTYVDALSSLVNPRTGRVHTSFNQAIASTGRLSSSNPNLQNIPIKTEAGRAIRKAFIPGRAGMSIVAADYSQIELRLMAHISGDEALLEAFRNGEDIHSTTAQKIFGVGAADVSREMRRKAKEVNFGIMYGIGPFGLSNRLGIEQAEAREIISTYFERFPKVRAYINDTLDKARREGSVTTLLGRRRQFRDINDRNQNVRGNAERQAINMPIQGSAADMIKVAMIDIHRDLPKAGIDAVMLLQVHDELVFEVADGDLAAAKEFVSDRMKNAMRLTVPIGVDVGMGKNWYEAH